MAINKWPTLAPTASSSSSSSSSWLPCHWEAERSRSSCENIYKVNTVCRDPSHSTTVYFVHVNSVKCPYVIPSFIHSAICPVIHRSVACCSSSCTHQPACPIIHRVDNCLIKARIQSLILSFVYSFIDHSLSSSPFRLSTIIDMFSSLSIRSNNLVHRWRN